MRDLSNQLKNQTKFSKKFSKKQNRKDLISSGINTHEEEKMETFNENQENVPFHSKNNHRSNLLIDSENEEENLELDIEAVKKSSSAEKNLDRLAEISHYLILKNVILYFFSSFNIPD